LCGFIGRVQGRGIRDEDVWLMCCTRVTGYYLICIFAPMYHITKRHRNEYRILNELPGQALSVAQYAKERQCNTSNIYKEYRTAREKGRQLPYEIVIYSGFNFIVPREKKD
jgi:hypothetical protein